MRALAVIAFLVGLVGLAYLNNQIVNEVRSTLQESRDLLLQHDDKLSRQPGFARIGDAEVIIRERTIVVYMGLGYLLCAIFWCTLSSSDNTKGNAVSTAQRVTTRSMIGALVGVSLMLAWWVIRYSGDSSDPRFHDCWFWAIAVWMGAIVGTILGSLAAMIEQYVRK